MRTKQLLESMRVPGDANSYVLGSFDQRITIYSQQVRALNLAFSLLENGRLEGKRLGIVGAGIAGMTFSAAAMHHGAHVTLFEKREEWVPLQRLSERWVHPHIYDWPFEGAESNQADLPFLDWAADSARSVVRMMLTSWNIERNSATDRFVEYRSCNIHSAGRQAIEGEDSDGVRIQGHFDSMIFAVGFGDEPNDWGTPSYWRSDDLDASPEEETRYLVSGCGDGGLIDLLRIALRDSDPRLLARKMAAPGLSALRGRILEIEERAGAEPDEDVADALLAQYYDGLRFRHEAEAEMLLQARRPRNRVTLNGRGPSPYSRRASALNRTLVAMLAPPYLSGEVAVCRSPNGGFKVDDGNRIHSFDRVVQRHGPRSSLQANFRKVHDACAAPMRGIARLDLTRERLFPADWGRKPAKTVPMFDARGRRLLVDSNALLSDAALGLDREWILSELRRACTCDHSWFAVLHGDGRQSLGLLLHRLLHEFMVRPPTETGRILRHDVYYAVNDDLHAVASGEEWLLAIRNALPSDLGRTLEERLAGATRYGPLLLIIGGEPFRSSTGAVAGLRELLESGLISVLHQAHHHVRVVLAIESEAEAEPYADDSVRHLLNLRGSSLFPSMLMPAATFPTRSEVESYCRAHGTDPQATREAGEQFEAIAAASTKNFKDAVDALDKITGAKQ